LTANATSTAAEPRREGLRAALLDPTVAAILVYAVVSIAAAIAAYFVLFTQFAPYDDEGTLLVTLKAFSHGSTLYSDIYSPYGPFYYELFGGLLALGGLDVTTELSRSTVLVIWVGTSLAYGVAAQRLTRSLMLGAAGMIAAFAALIVLANEPMHPQVLCIALLAAFTLLVTFEPERRPAWLGAGAGALVGALVMTKVNLGAFAVIAVALAAVLTVEPLHRRRWLRWPLIAAVLALPVVLMARDLDEGWARELALLEILATVAVVIAASLLRPRRDDDDRTLRWLLWGAAGLAAAVMLSLVAIMLNGSAPADIYDGVVTQAIRVRDVMTSAFPIVPAALDWGIAAVAASALVVALRGSSGRGEPALHPGVLRAVAGLAIWFTVSRATPFSLNPSAGNPNTLPLVLAWVAVVPPAAAVESPFKRFLRVLLPALAVIETLQVYPVAGSQAGIAAATTVPVGALILGDALTSLRAWGAGRGAQLARSAAVVLSVLAVAVAADLGLDAVARPAASNAITYRDQPSLGLPGAESMHLPPGDVETYSRLVELLRVNRCTNFIGYPNIDSLYLWSGIEPPPPRAPGAWVTALDSARQQRIVDELRATPRPCAFRSDTRANLWLHESPPPQRPLVRYIFNDFRPVEQVGEFEFLLPRAAPRAGSPPG
jgi:hypothetical protein